MKSQSTTIKDIANPEMLLKDKCWFVINKCGLSVEQKRKFVLGLIEAILKIYEKDRPTFMIRDCIEATKQYLSGDISVDTLMEKRYVVELFARTCIDEKTYHNPAAGRFYGGGIYYIAKAASFCNASSMLSNEQFVNDSCLTSVNYAINIVDFDDITKQLQDYITYFIQNN